MKILRVVYLNTLIQYSESKSKYRWNNTSNFNFFFSVSCNVHDTYIMYMYVSHICVLHTHDILHIHTSYIYMYTTYYHMLPHTIYLAFEYQYGDGRSMYHILLYIFEIYISIWSAQFNFKWHNEPF